MRLKKLFENDAEVAMSIVEVHLMSTSQSLDCKYLGHSIAMLFLGETFLDRVFQLKINSE